MPLGTFFTALPSQTLLEIKGIDSARFLNALFTQDILSVDIYSACYAALLSTQGKIITDCILLRASETTFIMEVFKESLSFLMQKLTLYKLNSDVLITPITHLTVWTGSLNFINHFPQTLSFADPRSPLKLARVYLNQEEAKHHKNSHTIHDISINNGLPILGIDFLSQDSVPHDLNMDLLNGLSFSKGCYIGQEIVSRMHHKNAIRKRVLIFLLNNDFQNSSYFFEKETIFAEEKILGTTGLYNTHHGFALIRTDFLQSALAEKKSITINNCPITIYNPPYAPHLIKELSPYS